MQNTTSRILSLLLALVMVLSMVPTVFAAEDSVSVTYVAENTTTGVQYENLDTAIAEAQAGQIVKALADAENVTYGNEGVILDLNGHDLSVTVAEGVTLSAIDSATDDYEGEYGSLTTDGTVATTVKTTGEVKSYVTIAENGSYTFHRYYAAIAAISLKPTQVSLGYRAEFRGDEAVKNAVVGYGYELWINDNAHKTYTRTDKLEKSSLTLRLKNILSEGSNALNALGSTATIGGNAFITLNLGGEEVTLYGTEQETTLRQVVESVNANVSSYGEAQLQTVRDMCTTYAAWMEGWETDAIFGKGEGEGDDTGLKVEITVDVTAENGVLTQDATLSSDDITVTVPQGTTLEDGVTQLVLTITEKASSDSDITAEEDETLIPLDVHIEGISESNTTPILVCLGEILPKGLNIGNYALYHVENGETVEMTHVLTLDELDTHNEFHYDPATGAVTVAMASFSEITLTSKAAAWEGKVDPTWYDANATTLYIYNADQLWSFSQIVGGMTQDENGNAMKDAEGNVIQDSFAGKTVILHTDIDLNDAETGNVSGKIFYPIGYWNSEGTYEKSGTAISSGFYTFQGTFDGNGHIIANFYQNTWEMKGDHNWYAAEDQHYRDGMGLFGKVYGGTVKNLTVTNFSSDGEIATTGTIAAYADNGATFENITIFNCNPRVYNIGNGGIVGCVGWYNNETSDENPVTFRNITVDNTNKISALWGSWDVACGGIVGQYYPTSGQTNATDNAGIYMENCHVAAQIDVNNDVCANYQYYAYRYAGMLIGSVRENVTVDGRVYPDMTGITAKDCTVHFGDWNDYYYCELVANSIASYTHDYQFSRLTQVASVDVENMKVTTLDGKTVDIPAGRVNYVVVTGEHATENAKCFHFVNGVQHFHDVADNDNPVIDETVNGETVLKENNQHIYLEFNNLVTGYGWGVTSKGLGQMDGVTILDNYGPASKDKFTYVGEETYTPGTMLTIGQLFTANDGDDLIFDTDNVQVFVSPADSNSTAAGEYTINTTDWTAGTLLLTGEGAATITITDYLYCNPLTVTVTLDESEDDTETPTTSYGLIKTLDDLLDGGKLVVVAYDREEEVYYAMTSSFGDESIGVTPVTIKDNAVYFDEGVTPSIWIVEGNKTEGTLVFSNGESYITHKNGKSDIVASTESESWTAEVPPAADSWVSEYSFYIKSTTGDGRGLVFQSYNNFAAYSYSSGNNSANQLKYTCYLQFYRVGEGCDHINQVTVPAKAATCTEAGYTEGVYCNDCQRYLNGHEIINAKGHQWQGKYTYQEANCTQQGIQQQKCWNCEAVRLYYTPAGDHSYTYEVTTEATCTTEGVKTGTCAGCGGTVTEAIPALGHSYEGNVTTAATCGVAGVMTYTCSACGDTYTEAIPATGEHNYVGKVTTAATCGAAGVMTYTCSACGDTYTEAIPATGEHSYGDDGICTVCGAEEPKVVTYTVTYEVPESVTAITADVVEEGSAITLPTAEAPEGYSFVGWTTGTVNNTTEKPDCYEENTAYTPTDDITLYAVYSYSEAGTGSSDTYTLVTDASTLAVGDKVIIVASDSNYALSTTQNSNNRGQTSITKNGNTITLSDNSDVQIITLEYDTISGTYAFNTGSGYLYAASSSSNYLRTEATLSDNSSWTIAISTAGVATVKANGDNTRNWMRYNSSNNPPIFSCYSSGQADISLYKQDGGSTTYYTTVICDHSNATVVVTAPTCTEPGYTTHTCTCGHTWIDTEVVATGHSYNAVVTDPTETEQGYTTYTCSVCGDSYVSDYTDPTGGETTAKTETMEIYGTTGTKSSNGSSISWSGTNYIFTNDEGDTAIRTSDSNHYRLYKNSTVTISSTSNTNVINKIVITCTSNAYATVLATSLKEAGYDTASASGTSVTVTFASITSVKFTLTAQSRISKVEINP